LLKVWGLGTERGMEGLGVNPRGVVINEGIRRSSFRGVVDVVYGGEAAVEAPQDKNGGKGTKGKENTGGIGKKGSGKRKVDEVDGNGGKEGTPTLSKRAAKKARLQALKDEEASSPAPSTETTSKAPSKTEDTPGEGAGL